MILGKAARYGLYAAITMAERPDQLTTAGKVSRLFGVSADHVAKVLHKLARARLARSVRGVGGGYQLAVDPRKLTMLEVVEAVDGPLLPECLGCDRGGGQSAIGHFGPHDLRDPFLRAPLGVRVQAGRPESQSAPDPLPSGADSDSDSDSEKRECSRPCHGWATAPGATPSSWRRSWR